LSTTCGNAALVASYSFSGNANDESGNGFDGIVSGASLTEDRFGVENSAYYFDGVMDSIKMPGLGDAVNGEREITISFWMRPESPEAWRNPLSFGNSKFRFESGPSTSDSFIFDSGFNSTYVYTQQNNDQWNYMEFIANASGWKFSVNSVNLATGTTSGFMNAGLDMYLGTRDDNVSAFWRGAIDDVRIYNHHVVIPIPSPIFLLSSVFAFFLTIRSLRFFKIKSYFKRFLISAKHQLLPPLKILRA